MMQFKCLEMPMENYYFTFYNTCEDINYSVTINAYSNDPFNVLEECKSEVVRRYNWQLNEIRMKSVHPFKIPRETVAFPRKGF